MLYQLQHGYAINLPTLFQAHTGIQALVTLLLCIDRPKTAPLEVLGLLIGLLATRLISLVYIRPMRHFQYIGSALEATVATFSVAIVLHMPLRSPELPRGGIGLALERPTQQLRSPEDNLRLWQYMTVSWMSPLISVGSSRQLSDDDVWSLGFEFQHRILHNKFRELTGSVVGRLLVANGLDLIILSFLGVLESASSMTPCFVDQRTKN